MRFSNLFMLTSLPFFLHISASPLKVTENTKPDNDFNLSKKLPKTQPNEVIGKVVPIYGYQCRENFYLNSFLKQAAALGASQLKNTKFQQYPMILKPGYYIYPIFPNNKIRWAQGQPEGFDRVVFDSYGNVLYAATAHNHPGVTVESAYQSCVKVNKSLPHLPGKSSIFTRFGSPIKFPSNRLNPSSPAAAFNIHLGNNARNYPIHAG